MVDPAGRCPIPDDEEAATPAHRGTPAPRRFAASRFVTATLLGSALFVATPALGLVRGVGAAPPAPAAAVAAQASSLAAVQMTAAAPAGRLVRLVALAKQQVAARIPYLYGGGHAARPAPLGSRVDCSGLVRELYWAAFGMDIGGGSGDSSIRLSGNFVKTRSPVPGDVALYGYGGVGPAHHAAIFIGALAGRVTMVGAPQTGQLIKYQYPTSSYWASQFMGYWHLRAATPADSASAAPVRVAPAHRVRGHLDKMVGGAGSVTVSGWALDDALPARSSVIAMIVDGRLRARIAASRDRTDVNRVLRVSGPHGFHAGVGLSTGSHRVCLIGMRLTLASRSVVLGCSTVSVAGRTGRGSAGVTGARLRVVVSGWAVDAVAPMSRVRLRVTDGNRLVAAPFTTRLLPVVNRVLGISGTHGFSVPVALRAGIHRICTTALPNSPGSAGTALGCRTVIVRP